MALTDPQVRRYARQILLREVGGRGQERLLSTTVEVMGDDPALDVAIAYLAAGGSPLVSSCAPRAFLEGTSLDAFAPDSVPRSPAAIVLCSVASLPPTTAAAVVTVGSDAVAVRAAGVCSACFDATIATWRAGTSPAPEAPGLSQPPTAHPPGAGEPTEAVRPVASAVLRGALAALAVQRLALGLGDAGGVVAFDDGALASSALARCPTHR